MIEHKLFQVKVLQFVQNYSQRNNLHGQLIIYVSNNCSCLHTMYRYLELFFQIISLSNILLEALHKF